MSEMTLGQKIRELRLSKQMTQKELAGEFITRNMLSQIENDTAMPSMKTMEYLAGKLEKPIGYFLDAQHEDVSLTNMITELIDLHDKKDYQSSATVIESYIAGNPMLINNKIIKDLYVSTYMYMGNQYILEGSCEKAKDSYEKLLQFESDMIITSDIRLYKIYTQLAEANTCIAAMEEAKVYYEKGQMMLKKMTAGREVQSLYMKLMEGDTSSLIEAAGEVDSSNYDPYNLARYHMIMGSAYFNDEKYEEAIDYLEKSLVFYEKKPRNTITAVIYEELSKCYSQIDDYKKAYDYLHKARENKK